MEVVSPGDAEKLHIGAEGECRNAGLIASVFSLVPRLALRRQQPLKSAQCFCRTTP